MRLLTTLAVCALVLSMAASASAGPVLIGGPWYEFAFGGVGSFATDGTGTIPSSGGNSVFADKPPWTFTGGAGGVLLTVTDAFNNGDAFEIFDNAISIGTTPLVAASGSSGDDPAISVLDPAASHAAFLLGPGSHSITIQTIASPYGGGAGYFRLDRGIPTVPAPGALLLAGSGLLAVFRCRRRIAR